MKLLWPLKSERGTFKLNTFPFIALILSPKYKIQREIAKRWAMCRLLNKNTICFSSSSSDPQVGGVVFSKIFLHFTATHYLFVARFPKPGWRILNIFIISLLKSVGYWYFQLSPKFSMYIFFFLSRWYRVCDNEFIMLFVHFAPYDPVLAREKSRPADEIWVRRCCSCIAIVEFVLSIANLCVKVVFAESLFE